MPTMPSSARCCRARRSRIRAMCRRRACCGGSAWTTAFSTLRGLGVHEMDGRAERFGLAMAIGALPTSLDRLVRAYATLAEDGIAEGLVWLRGQRRGAPRRLIATDAARLVDAVPQRPDGPPAQLSALWGQ